MREISIEGCELIGSGASGDVYRLDDEIVVKVYKKPDTLGKIQQEQYLSRRAFIKGIPTVIPFGIAKVGEKYSSLFEIANAQTLSAYISGHLQELDSITAKYADFLNVFHSVEFSPDEVPSAKDVYISNLS
ncbi:MAG: phosphotransferase, partial [Synergistaceae bacterium]|nr:phosphotransferase [Synergistaceae bacterium]